MTWEIRALILSSAFAAGLWIGAAWSLGFI
jgi:hypothetical protein